MEQRWWHKAACADYDVNLFYPSEGGTTTYRVALSLCGKCPVRRECLDEAITNMEDYGMWGGLTPDGRQRYVDRMSGVLPPADIHGDAVGTRVGFFREIRAGVTPCDPCREGYNREQKVNRDKRKAAKSCPTQTHSR